MVVFFILLTMNNHYEFFIEPLEQSLIVLDQWPHLDCYHWENLEKYLVYNQELLELEYKMLGNNRKVTVHSYHNQGVINLPIYLKNIIKITKIYDHKETVIDNKYIKIKNHKTLEILVEKYDQLIILYEPLIINHRQFQQSIVEKTITMLEGPMDNNHG